MYSFGEPLHASSVPPFDVIISATFPLATLHNFANFAPDTQVVKAETAWTL